MQEIRNILSSNMRVYRKLSNLTQTQLADRCGVHYQTIQRIEGQSRWPSPEVLEKIAGVLQTTPSELLQPPKDIAPEKSAISSESILKTLAEQFGLSIVDVKPIDGDIKSFELNYEIISTAINLSRRDETLDFCGLDQNRKIRIPNSGKTFGDTAFSSGFAGLYASRASGNLALKDGFSYLYPSPGRFDGFMFCFSVAGKTPWHDLAYKGQKKIDNIQSFLVVICPKDNVIFCSSSDLSDRSLSNILFSPFKDLALKSQEQMVIDCLNDGHEFVFLTQQNFVLQVKTLDKHPNGERILLLSRI